MKKADLKSKRLNAKQRRFCEEYLIDMNATQAAIRAGYSSRTAGSQAHDLLKKPEIQEKIEENRDALAAKTGITQERVLQEFGKIAFFDPQKLFDSDGNMLPMQDLPPDVAAVIAGLDVVYRRGSGTDEEGKPITDRVVKVKLVDKKGALDSLSKHLGMFEKDNQQKRPALQEVFDALSVAAPELADAVKKELAKKINAN